MIFKELVIKASKQRIKHLLVFIFLCGGIIALLGKNIPAYFLKVTEISEIKDIKDSDISSGVFVKIKGKDFFDTGYVLKTKNLSLKNLEFSKENEFFYGIVALKDGFLITKVSYRWYGREFHELEFVGRLTLPDNYRTLVITNLTPKSDFITEGEFQQKFSPTYVEVVGGEYMLGKVLCTFAVVGMVIGVFWLFIELWREKDYRRHKSYKRLSKIGNPQKICEDIAYEQDKENGYFIMKGEDFLLTRTYLIIKKGYEVKVFPTLNLCKVHKRVVKKLRFFFFVKTVTYLCFTFFSKKKVFVKMQDENRADELLNLVNQRFPVDVGFDK